MAWRIVAVARYLVLAVVPLAAARAQPGAAEAPARLTPVPFTDVKLADSFLAPRIETNRAVSIPHDLAWCEKAGRMANFEAAAKRPAKWDGNYQGAYCRDCDVYKVIEGCSYSLAVHADPQLDKRLDDIIARIAAAQEPDGYINTYYQLVEPGKRWTNLKDKHEMYNGGHLIEAAVAHHRATGKRTLLDVAIKFADHVDSLFGPGKRVDVCGHEEIELALLKLYHLTKQERYLALARFFLDTRGNPAGRPRLYGEYCQDHLPVRAQREIGGHAVRAMYLYSAVADVAAVTDDPGFVTTMDAVWNDVTLRKMYLTGGIGPSAKNEGFTVPYDLPNETAYAETCAAIGMAFWNHRLNLLHAHGKYFDVVERALYNGLLSGVSLDGQRFFYVNPLASKGTHHRQEWFGTACCPSNIVRFLPSLGGYAYATGPDGIFVNLYAASEAKVNWAGHRIGVRQETRYPWDGQVKLILAPDAPRQFDLNLRIPDWCSKGTVKVNGEGVANPAGDRNYLTLSRTWKPGDAIDLDMPMKARRVRCNPQVKANVGRVAIQRGPIVYCMEGADQPGADLFALAIPEDAPLDEEYKPDLLGGVTTIRTTALEASRSNDARPPLYSNVLSVIPRDVTLIPYALWDNRQPGQMIVWTPTDPTWASQRDADVKPKELIKTP
jgi:DUF1680 family protein